MLIIAPNKKGTEQGEILFFLFGANSMANLLK